MDSRDSPAAGDHNLASRDSPECPICLEHIAAETLIGQVDPCRHLYHSPCIQQWASHSNSCPTCRKLFYRVDVRRMRSARVLSSFRVQDKLAENAAIDHIPQEYVLPPAAPAYATANPPDSQTNTGVCIICSSAQYSHQQMFACVACGGGFHSRCLGYANEGYWFCPVCDYQMEQPEGREEKRSAQASQVSFSARAPRRPTRPPAAPSGQDLLRGIARPRPRPRRVTGHPELAEGCPETDDFSDDDGCVQVTSSGRARVLANGGSRLRRQERELQSLTVEEVQSWQMLESARSGIEPAVENDVGEKKGPRKKRTRASQPKHSVSETESFDSEATLNPGTRPLNPGPNPGTNTPHPATNTPHPATNTVNPNPKSSGGNPSRISSLMKQIQSRRPTNITYSGSAESPIEVSDSVKRDPDAFIAAEEKPKQEIDNPGPDLSLEQKRLVQSHVRGLLRPHYRNPNVTTPIHSEEEYIAINKTLSRRIYKRILASEPGRFFGPNQNLLGDLCKLCWSEYNES